jgi:hypothetical protein
MQTNDDLILAEEFCNNHNIAFSFISALHQNGLVEITSVEQNVYIPQSELARLEQMMRLHTDLDINIEGIDAITHLLERLQMLQLELAAVKSRLKLYENLF